MLFLEEVVWVYITAAAVNENVTVTEAADVWNKAVQIKEGPLALSFPAQRRTDLLKQSDTTADCFADSSNH